MCLHYCKAHPITAHEGPELEQMYSFTLPSTSALDGGWVVNATLRPLYPPPPQERPGTHYTGGRVGPRAGLDGYGKCSPTPGFDPRTVQPVASSYTDCAIPAPVSPLHKHKNWSVISHRTWEHMLYKNTKHKTVYRNYACLLWGWLEKCEHTVWKI